MAQDKRETGFVEKWPDLSTQCQYCVNFRLKNGRCACVTKGLSFEEALDRYGEIRPESHCNYFMLK